MMRSQRIRHLILAMIALAIVFPATRPAEAGALSASLRSRIERFVAERAGGPVDSISVPPLGDFELAGVDPASIRIELSTRAWGRLSGAVAVNVVLSNDERILKRGIVTTMVRANEEVWVAARDLARGTPITRKDLRLELIDLRAAHSGATSDLAELVGLQLHRSLREGAVLRTRDLSPVSIVTRGQTVRIVVRRDGLKLVGRGRAVTDGALGEHIRVINTDSRREVTGRVEKDGSVHVDL